MAIALDSDFRSVKSQQPADTVRPRAAKSEAGEDFASKLERAREELSDEASLPSTNSAPAAPAPVSTWAEPATAAEQAVLSPAAASVAAPIEAIAAPQASVDLANISELKTDRDLVRADIAATQAGTAIPGTATPTDQAVVTAHVAGAAPATEQQTTDAVPKPERINASATEGAMPATPANTVALAAAGIAAVPVPQPSAGNDKATPGAPVAAPKSAVKLAAVAAAEAGETPPSPVTGTVQDVAVAPVAGASDGAVLDAGTQSGQGSTPLTFATAAPGTAPPAATVSTAIPTPFSTPNPVLVAVPAEIVDIVSKTAEDGQSDRVVVQLDPPELGRVSIDFKFDAQGVQHVIITSETPEAMRQLRQMHSELVQALERQGIGSQNMTFQHQQQSSQQSPLNNPLLRVASSASAAVSGASLLTVTPSNPSLPRLSPGGRLDIRL